MISAVPVIPSLESQAQRLAAYLPLTLVRDILQQGPIVPGHPHTLIAATLFADISGFTAMSEELAGDGPRGAEEVNRVLLQTFTAMVDVIHNLGGAISHFYGDAMSVYFPEEDGQAAARALACAQQMQQLMLSRFHTVQTSRPAGKNPGFPLTMKIGVGYGRCQEWVVGSPQSSLEFVLAGPAVDEAAQAEKQASAGQIVASCAVLQHANLPCSQPFALLEAALPAPSARPLLNWLAYDSPALQRLIKTALPFIPPALQQRLTTPGLEVLAEHRPVTSMFVQFELEQHGETALSGAQLQQYYLWACQVVARFAQANGRVNRVLTGDKGNQLHIIFGAPVAPDAPEQAIRCALALQRERPAFVSAQRIGLCTGKVFAGPVGSETRREYTVVGDVVNLSARLTAVCAPGDVLTEASSAERVANLLEFAPLPPRKMKGKQSEVTPYRAIGERVALTQVQAYFDVERPLIGREAELETLQAALHAARQGSGGLAIISGSAGVGKTRLLGELVRQWQNDGGMALLGICYPHTADTPYAAWQTIWQTFFRLSPNMDAAAQATAVQQMTRALWPGVGDDVGLWAEVLSLPIPQAPHLAELTAEARQARFFTLVLRCFLASGTPLLLTLENIHWADQATLALIDHLTLHLRHAPIYLALTVRDSALLEQLRAKQDVPCTILHLSDLSPQEGRRLLHHLLGATELPPIIEQQLGLRDREGRDSPVNPLFLQEATNMMLEVGVLRRENGHLYIHEGRLRQVQLPDTIHGLLLARLDRLSPASRDLLQVASVIGRQFGVEPLRVMLPGFSRSVVNELLTSLSAEEMTRLITTEPDWIYLFQHAMTHEVAYESLPYVRRQDLHAGLAQWLEEAYAENLKPIHAILAYHYSRANDHAKAIHFALAGAEDARNVFANGDAIELYNLAEAHLLALGLETWWETAVTLYLCRSHVRILAGDLVGAAEDAARALPLAQAHGNMADVVIAHNNLAEIRYRQGKFTEALEQANHVITNLATHATPDQLARAYILAGWTTSSRLEHENALAYLKHAEEICQATNNHYRRALALEAMAFHYYGQRKLADALAAMQQSVTLSRKFSTPVNIGFALNNVAYLQFEVGRAEEALSTFNEAVSIGQETSRNLLAIALYNRAAVHAYLGQYATSLAGFEEAVQLLEPRQHTRQLIEAFVAWGFEYDCALGYWAAAQERFTQALHLTTQQPESYPEEQAQLYLGLTLVSLHQQQWEMASEYLTRAEQLIRERNLLWWRPGLSLHAGYLEMARGNIEAARQQFIEGLTAVDKGGSPDCRAPLLLELARLESDPVARIAYYQQCAQAAQARARHKDKLRCYQEAGTFFASQQDPEMKERGLELLRQAQQLQVEAERISQFPATSPS